MWYKNESYPNKEKAVNALIESVVDGVIENNGVKISDEKLYKYAKGCVDLRLWCKEYDRIGICSIIKDAIMKDTECNEFNEALNKIGGGLKDVYKRCCMQCFLDWCYKKSYGEKPKSWELKHGWIVEAKNGTGSIKGKVVYGDNVKLVVFEDGNIVVLSQGLMNNVDKIWNCEKFSECRDECLVWSEV